MKFATQIGIDNRLIKRLFLCVVIASPELGLIGASSDAVAQQVNPYAISPPARYAPESELSPHPVARARLQTPQVSSSPDSRLVSEPRHPGNIEKATSAASRVSTVPVGPLWSSFTPGSFEAPQIAARPARLPTTGSEGTRNDHTPPTRLASAARQRSQFIAQTTPPPVTAPSVYLASQTAQSRIDEAAKLFQQATLEYECAAYASAETSAWDSLEKAAMAIDLSRPASDPASSAVTQLHLARRAIIEAQDFVGPFAQEDRSAIARLARSHQTPVVRQTLPPMAASYSAEARVRLSQSQPDSSVEAKLPTAGEAIDRYLDFARTHFADIAAESLLAAQTMDLLAAIRLGRDESQQLPGPTAICLRRAAVQGQSSNADLVARLGHQLADIGLIDEARWALGHSLALQPNPAIAARLASLNAASRPSATSPYGTSILAATRPSTPADPLPKRVPEVTTVSPEQFAAISHSVIPGSPTSPAPPSAAAEYHPQPAGADTPFQTSGTRTTTPQADPDVPSRSPGSFLRAVTASFKIPSPQSEASTPVLLPPQQPAERTSSRLLPGVKKWW